MKKREIVKRLLCLGMTLLFALSLVACKDQADEQDSQPPTTPTITPTEAPTPTPTPPIPYTDVPSDASYYDAVVWAYKNGIASDGTMFDPASACTRGQVVTSLWRAMGSPEPQTAENPISDITPDDWYYQPALWAYESGIITNTIFNPGNPCTNAEVTTILWRAYGEPAADVYSSPISLANPSQYYTRAVAWADNSGMFAGMDSAFDPSAQCSRADLITYLYWTEEQWTFSEEDRTVQAEYEQIIKDTQIFDVHGSGLLYADYVDVDGDGKVELLTFDSGNNLAESGYKYYEITATVYAAVNGHVEKICDYTFDAMGSYGYLLYICTYDGHVCFRAEGLLRMSGPCDEFYIIEDGVIKYNEYTQRIDWTPEATYEGTSGALTESEYNAINEKYTDQKELFYNDFQEGISAYDRGILPVPGVEVNGIVVQVSSISEGVFMVPLRDVLEAMGVAVYANSDASVILVSTKSDSLIITNVANPNLIGKTYSDIPKTTNYRYSMNDSEYQDIPVDFINGKAFVPLQIIVSLFGATTEWSGETGTMRVTSNIPDSSRMSQAEINAMASFSSDEAIQIVELHGYTVVGDWEVLRVKSGNSIWSIMVVKEYYTQDEWGAIGMAYPVEVTNSGFLTAYPEQTEYFATGEYSGQT